MRDSFGFSAEPVEHSGVYSISTTRKPGRSGEVGGNTGERGGSDQGGCDDPSGDERPGAPKNDDPAAGQSTGETAESRQPPAQARDPGGSTSRTRDDFGAPSDNHSAPQGENEGGDNRRDVSGPEDPGIYASYDHYIGGARLAAASIPMDGVAGANPANWANVTRLERAVFRLTRGDSRIA